MRQFHPGPFCWHWAYFENWGYPKENIREGDWHNKLSLGEDVVVHMLPARHYSGRLFKENKTLWAGFALETPEHKIFFSGDSGYGSHFSQIGKTFNGFDLVIMSRATLFRRIILPQAIRIGLPAYGNEVVYTIKCQHRQPNEITGTARNLVAKTYKAVEIFLVAACLYLCLVFSAI